MALESMFDESFLDAYRNALFSRADWNLPWSQEVLFDLFAGFLQTRLCENCFTRKISKFGTMLKNMGRYAGHRLFAR